MKEERGFRTRREWTDTALEDKERALAEMDPEVLVLSYIEKTKGEKSHLSFNWAQYGSLNPTK